MKHVVVVDDNPDFLDLMSQESEGASFQMTPVLDRDNQDLLPLIISLKPDLLLLDIFLISLTAKEFCEAFRATDQGKRVTLFLISYTDYKEMQAVRREVNADGVLSKPIKREKIEEILLDIDKK